MNLSLSEQISYSTVRIEVITNEGFCTGTGFFFNFFNDTADGTFMPCVITNKHVVKGAVKGTLVLTCKNQLDTEYLHRVNISEFESSWIMHPDDNVDLCLMPMALIILTLNQKGIYPHWIPLDKNLIPNELQLKELSLIEEIFMVGYPNGIWDDVNNKPIFRKGITATHPNIDFKGNKEFMIDTACYPGSSGSPVLIINQSGFAHKNGAVNLGGKRVFLLGILYAGPIQNMQGQIKFVDIPSTITPIPINLGLVIKSERILEFEPIIKKIVDSQRG